MPSKALTFTCVGGAVALAAVATVVGLRRGRPTSVTVAPTVPSPTAPTPTQDAPAAPVATPVVPSVVTSPPRHAVPTVTFDDVPLVKVPRKARTTTRPVKPRGVAPLTLSLGDGDAAPVMSTPAAPDLETARAAEEKLLLAAGKTGTDLRVDGDCECATPGVTGTAVSPNHVVVQLPSRRFLFRLHGVKGRTVRIDLTHDTKSEEAGGRTNPLYSYATDLAAAAGYDGPTTDAGTAAGAAWNGADLPATDHQAWHFVRAVWNSAPQTISLVQRFDADDVTIAMRVPRPSSYNGAYFAGLAGNPNVHVIEVGKTPEGRPLLIAKVGTGDDAAERRRPCVCVYGGEHADAPDPMWTAQGSLDFLIGDSAAARSLRDKFTFLVIPTLDPDATAAGVHSHIIVNFMTTRRMPENIAYANWFEDWVNRGKRLDVVLNLDGGNFGGASTDAVCYVIEGNGTRGELALGLHRSMAAALSTDGFTARQKPLYRGWTPQRLGGWSTRRFGAFTVSYGVDSQEPGRHLNVQQLRAMGASLVTGIATALADPTTGPKILAEVDDRRQIRTARLAKFRPRGADEDAIMYEAAAAMADPQEQILADRETVIP